MVECEKRGIPYLFKLRQTAKVKNLIHLLEQEGGWVDCGQGLKVSREKCAWADGIANAG
jgi:hypothetical protein